MNSHINLLSKKQQMEAIKKYIIIKKNYKNQLFLN
jgi:hypothetical protein